MTRINPEDTAALIESERQRIASLIDQRIASWEKFYEDFPEVDGTLVVISELDYIRSRLYDSTTKRNRR